MGILRIIYPYGVRIKKMNLLAGRCGNIEWIVCMVKVNYFVPFVPEEVWECHRSRRVAVLRPSTTILVLFSW